MSGALLLVGALALPHAHGRRASEDNPADAVPPMPHDHVALLVQGTIDLPSFQSATANVDGFPTFEADGTPIIKGTHPVKFTLTLPGFAGVILTVGMAVDANVIIFEKIKEDLRAGKSPTVSIESGFAASFWTILDANVTTLIAAVILYIPKDGPIMGFAITLFFGLVSSMFTSLFISHLLFDWFTYLVNVRKLSIGWGFERRKRAA